MPRPTALTGWWKLLLDKRAQGKIGLLARLCEVDPRTLHRWGSKDIKIPEFKHRAIIRKVAGPELVNHELCPKYLRLKKKVQ